MDLAFLPELATSYKSAPQQARVLSEDWVQRALPCPNCGEAHLTRQNANRRVSDFVCRTCIEHFELKSSAKPLGPTIPDGAYSAMIERIRSDMNPNLLYLHYDRFAYTVRSLSLIPKHFLTVGSIKRRRPLGPGARRAGWIGCNIVTRDIPAAGLIQIVHDGAAQDQEVVQARWKELLFLRQSVASDKRQWLVETIRCIEQLGNKFALADLYGFEPRLRVIFPANQHIRPKLRQQLQVLRDNGYVAFLGSGSYRRIR